MGFEVLREEEQPFFKENKVAVPGRVTNFVSQGGKTQPTIQKNYLQYEGVGKPGTESDVLEVYLDNAYNVS
jgi:hypothetical protein